MSPEVAFSRGIRPAVTLEQHFRRQLGDPLLHDGGASEAEVQAYLERWGVMTPELAAHMIRFFTAPTSRTYIITYPAGRELCRSYVAGEP